MMGGTFGWLWLVALLGITLVGFYLVDRAVDRAVQRAREARQLHAWTAHLRRVDGR